MLLSVLKEGASSLCLIASLVSTQGIQTTILSDLLHSSSQAQIQLGPSLGIDLLYSPFPSTKSNYPSWNERWQATAEPSPNDYSHSHPPRTSPLSTSHNHC